MKIDEGTQLLAFASGKPSFPIGQGGGETVAHDLLSSLHNRGFRVGDNPEAVENGGVLVGDKENPEAWLKRLELLEARYDEYSARARENGKRFSAGKAAPRLLEMIQSIQR